MKAFTPFLIIVSVILWSCNKQDQRQKGVLTNSQIFYDVIGTHNYPRIQFFGRIENLSKDTVKVTLENRYQVASHLNQFIWFMEGDTLKLMAYSFKDQTEGIVNIPPDSSFQLVLRTGDLAFWEETKNELSDSTYYRNLLKVNSTEGEIYFIGEKGNRTLMKRENSFEIIEGYKYQPAN